MTAIEILMIFGVVFGSPIVILLIGSFLGISNKEIIELSTEKKHEITQRHPCSACKYFKPHYVREGIKETITYYFYKKVEGKITKPNLEVNCISLPQTKDISSREEPCSLFQEKEQDIHYEIIKENI